jgi:hypothetical protein
MTRWLIGDPPVGGLLGVSGASSTL